MPKFKIEKIEGTIAYLEGTEIEQINTPDFIIFRVNSDADVEVAQQICNELKLKGVKKTFLILPKGVEYCVFKKGDKNGT